MKKLFCFNVELVTGEGKNCQTQSQNVANVK
jgi:hypothetical protein